MRVGAGTPTILPVYHLILCQFHLIRVLLPSSMPAWLLEELSFNSCVALNCIIASGHCLHHFE
jgi:hypothetical protein